VSQLYEFSDFAHFIDVWILTTNALRTRDDFRQVVVDYAEEAAEHGAVYLEAIFSPAERARRGVDWDEMFSGYSEGAQAAREMHGVEVRLTPDIFRGKLVAELRERNVVLDVCPVSNVRTGAVSSPAEHPLPQLLEAGVQCSLSTDDPAMFDTDLTREYEAAASLGADPCTAYEAGLAGALCDADTLKRLRRIAKTYDWHSLP
jgi:adenosine deaminase